MTSDIWLLHAALAARCTAPHALASYAEPPAWHVSRRMLSECRSESAATDPGKPLNDAWLRDRVWRPLLEKAGVRGVPIVYVSKQLGRSSISVTVDLYSKEIPQRLVMEPDTTTRMYTVRGRASYGRILDGIIRVGGLVPPG